MPVHEIRYMGRKHDVWQQEQTYKVFITLMSDKRYAVFSAEWNAKDPGLTVYADEECLRHAWDIDVLYKPQLMTVKIDPLTGQEIPD